MDTNSSFINSFIFASHNSVFNGVIFDDEFTGKEVANYISWLGESGVHMGYDDIALEYSRRKEESSDEWLSRLWSEHRCYIEHVTELDAGGLIAEEDWEGFNKEISILEDAIDRALRSLGWKWEED